MQPHWDRCEACGYSHHDDDPATAPVPSSVPEPDHPDVVDAPTLGSDGGASPEPLHADHASLPPPPPPPPSPVLGSTWPPSPTSPTSEPASGPSDPSGPPAFGAPADPVGQWEHDIPPASGPERQPTTDGAGDRAAEREAGAPEKPPRRGKRITAAQGAKTSSSFELNRVAVGAVVVIAALVLVWQGAALLGDDVPVATGPVGSTIPPLGAIASTTTPLTTPDGVTIVPPLVTTTTIVDTPTCDSIRSVYSADGTGYTPCDAGFQIDLPGRADIQSKTGDTALGPVTWTSLSSTDTASNPWIRSVVVYGTLPTEVAPDDVADVQEALIRQLLAEPTGATTFQDRPAMRFRLVDRSGETIEGVAFVDGSRAIALAARSPGSPSAGLGSLERSFVFL